MRILIIGNTFRIPLLLYDICLYGGILLTLASAGALLFGTIKSKKTHGSGVWPIIFIAGILMLVPVALAMIYGLGEQMA